MKGFFNVQTPTEFLQKIERFKPVAVEKVDLEDALHRVLAEDVFSSVSLPEFPRSTVDGFALKARDTYGASEGNPVILEIVGEIPVGQISEIEIQDGQAVKVATGGMVPRGADAVQMLEFTEGIDSRTLHVFKTASPLENMIQVGEDIEAGEIALPKGRCLRPQDLGLLAGIGIKEVPVFLKPRVAVISSGDEIVSIDQRPRPGQIRDINRYCISSMVTESGGMPRFLGIARDRFEELRTMIEQGLRESDMVVVSGGSSVGALDLTLDVLRSIPGSEVLAHGVSIRPGKPTLLTGVGGKPLLGLPGHPVSAMVVFHLFGRPLVKLLAGLNRMDAFSLRRIKARVGRNIPSVSGREDYVRVSLEERDGAFWAYPLFGKSGAIAHLAKADGLLRIGIHEEGLEEGEEAEVILL